MFTENVEKPIVIHYAKYLGLLSSKKLYPLEEDAYVKFYQDRVVIDLLKSKHQTVIPYKNMADMQNIDAGKKYYLESFRIRYYSRSYMEKACSDYSDKIFE
jgi:uncharacterized protein YueI